MKLIHHLTNKSQKILLTMANCYFGLIKPNYQRKRRLPLSAKEGRLIDWYQTNIATKANLIRVEVFFPCSKEEHPIPSPIMCNYCDIDDIEHKSLKPLALHASEWNPLYRH